MVNVWWNVYGNFSSAELTLSLLSSLCSLGLSYRQKIGLASN